MRILFMGTPDIAASALLKLIEEKFNIVGVVSQPDKPKGRGHKLMPTDVKVVALENNIEVFQPETLKNGELKEVLENLKPDVIVVVAYGKILPKYILEYPKYGCINMHASLLPKYRGAAPIQWSVINGDLVTGVTTMLMNEGLDTGDMLLTKEVEIGEYETSAELFEKMAVVGGEVLVETLNNIETLKPVPQNHEESTYAPMISKEMGNIDWSKPARVISKLVCGMNGWPLAYTFYMGEMMKVISASVGEDINKGEIGEILGYEKDKGLRIKCGEGSLYITRVQFAGGKKMEISEYLKGHTINAGEILRGE